MLIDKDEELGSEIVAEEVKIQDVPEFYKGKSVDELVKMHQDAQSMIGKQAQEVGEVRKLADDLIKQNLSSKPKQQEAEPEIDFFENPQKAVEQSVSNHPDVLAGRQAAQDFKKMQIQQKLAHEHPDFGQIVQDPEFINWVKSSNVRLGLYAKADGEFDYDSANELLGTFKQLRGVKVKANEKEAEVSRTQTIKAAQVDVGGSGESSKRVYRRADLIRLKMTDPNRYESLSDEIMAAYSEGRVK